MNTIEHKPRRWKLAIWDHGGIAGFYPADAIVNRPGLTFRYFIEEADHDAELERARHDAAGGS